MLFYSQSESMMLLPPYVAMSSMLESQPTAVETVELTQPVFSAQTVSKLLLILNTGIVLVL